MTYIFQPVEAELAYNESEIYRFLGYKNNIPEDMIQEVRKVYGDCRQIVKPTCGYQISPVTIINGSIQCETVNFKSGKRVTGYLAKCNSIAVFTATIGDGLETLSRQYFSDGEPVKGYISDIIGSVLTELTVDWLEQQIINHVGTQDLLLTNRFSPGYCNWDVSEQQKLFSLLPDNFCGIQLTESSLMQPIKSVSGIIGLGKDVIRIPYECDICNRKDCFMRRQ